MELNSTQRKSPFNYFVFWSEDAYFGARTGEIRSLGDGC
jgi:hypothetical protein